MPILHFSWLGSPIIEVDGFPLRLEMRKTLGLLAYLSVSPKGSSRETLATMFWPEFDEQHSLTNLRRNLFSLNKSLPHKLLDTGRDEVNLRNEDWLHVDVEEFREQLSAAKHYAHPAGSVSSDYLACLEKALAIYKGDFLEGFNLKDCPKFDEWQLNQRERLRSEYAGALQQLVDYNESRGEWGKAIEYTQVWLGIDRLNESAQRMLIRLYSRSGQRRLAFRQYEALVDLLQTELGLAPEAETASLYESLLSVEAIDHAENGSDFLHSTSRKEEPLIKSKLFIPPLRVDRVSRPRLFELLDAGSQRSMTLVSAPAGFGKTTLLASWASHTSLPIAWLTIDEGDNDPVRFIAYLIAALDSVLSSGLSEQFQAFTRSFHSSIQPVLIQLINQLVSERDPFVIILDDYQFIHSLEIHQALTFLLERIPACMHLIVATRSDPPISLALLRARDQLVEIRMSDLYFNSEESSAFLKQVMALRLSNEEVDALEARTEGWIAGLQMAALAIRTAVSPVNSATKGMDREQVVSQFIKTFSGSNRFILDFLGEEVLAHQSEETRRFLLLTSILEHFSGPLCDAVTQTEGSQNILKELEKENLFVVPLDNQRHWYRYHHLFAELLFFKLKDTLSKKSGSERDRYPCLEELHLRAADWLEHNQLVGEAVHHFIEAKKYDQAAALIEMQAKLMLFNTGESYTLRKWLAEIPEELYLFRPRLNIAKAWTLILEDQFSAALERVEITQQMIQDQQDVTFESDSGELALIRGSLAELHTRDVKEMRTQGLLAWEKLSREDFILRGIAAWLVGASYLFDGDTGQAEHYLSHAIQLCQEASNIFITCVATLDLSNVRIEQGKYRKAYQLLTQTLKEISSGRHYMHPSLGYLYYGISGILLNWNELEKAERQLQLGIDLVAQDIPGEVFIMSAAILPHLKLDQGKRKEALRLAEECLQRVETYPLPYIVSMVRADLIHFWIRVGDRDHIEDWLLNCGLTPDDPIRCVHEREYIALAKALKYKGQTDEALKVLTRIHDLAKSQGRNGRLYHVLALQALALMESKNLDLALKTLETSLTLARPEGYIRPYADEGKPMEDMLQMGATRGVWAQARLDSYVTQLLKVIQLDRAKLEP